MNITVYALCISLILNLIQSLINIFKCIRDEQQLSRQKERDSINNLELHPHSLLF